MKPEENQMLRPDPSRLKVVPQHNFVSDRIITEATFDKELGAQIQYEGFAFPEKFLPYPEACYPMHSTKKMLMMFLWMLTYKPLLVFLWPFAIPFLLKGLINKFVQVYTSTAHVLIEQYVLTEENFCRSAQELRRVAFKMAGENKPFCKLIDILSMVWEYDNMYRYRFQDFFYEFDKESFLINPKRELERVLNIVLQREKLDIRKTKYLAKALCFSLNYSFIRTLAYNFIKELDIDKVKPDEADQYFMLFVGNYKCFGFSDTERYVTRRRIHIDKGLKPF